MAVLIASGTALSTAANTKTADLITGTYQFISRGKVTLVAKGSATGMYATLTVGGVAIVNDLPISFTGTAGTISAADNVLASQAVTGGKVEFYLRNVTGGALTTDYLIYYEPGGK